MYPSAFLPLLAVAGCLKSIDPGGDDTGQGSTVQPGEAVIDATSETNWVYLDLERARVVTPADPADDPSWDMGFRRYKVSSNGGVSGTGGLEVSPRFGADYNAISEVPSDGWVSDRPDADGDGDLEYAFDTWFDYDSDAHEVTPAAVVFVVRTVERNHVKLEFLGYYDHAGTPGYVHLHWGPLDDSWTPDDTGDTGPEGEIACTTDAGRLTSTDAGGGVTVTRVDARSEDDWACVDFPDGLVPKAWDLALQEWTFVTTAEVAVLSKQDFDTLKTAPTDGYVTDDGTGSVFEDWYVYDATEHTLDPADVVYVLHDAEGGWYKMEILSYYPDGDTSQPGWPSWRWAPLAAPGR